MRTPLRITWVLPSLAFTGGIRVVYEHTRQLRARGHEVRLVVPTGPAPVPFSAAGRRALAGLVRGYRVDLLHAVALREDHGVVAHDGNGEPWNLPVGSCFRDARIESRERLLRLRGCVLSCE